MQKDILEREGTTEGTFLGSIVHHIVSKVDHPKRALCITTLSATIYCWRKIS